MDPVSNEVREIAPIGGPDFELELAGTPDGLLYGAQMGNYATQASIVQVDTVSGAVLDEIPVGPGLGLSSTAIAVLGDTVYTFGKRPADPGSRVRLVDRTSRRVTDRGTLGFEVVGAGASTCASRAVK
jgi:hypothetical protein